MSRNVINAQDSRHFYNPKKKFCIQTMLHINSSIFTNMYSFTHNSYSQFTTFYAKETYWSNILHNRSGSLCSFFLSHTKYTWCKSCLAQTNEMITTKVWNWWLLSVLFSIAAIVSCFQATAISRPRSRLHRHSLAI